MELLRHWTWQPAVGMADFGLTHYPDSHRLRFAKGVALYGDTQFVAAANVFASLLRDDPDNPSYGDLLGRSCSATGGGDSPQCGALIDFAQKHPGNAPVAVYAAISILHRPADQGNLPLAEHLLRQSIAVDPNASEAFYQLGALQQQRGAGKQAPPRFVMPSGCAQPMQRRTIGSRALMLICNMRTWQSPNWRCNSATPRPRKRPPTRA